MLQLWPLPSGLPARVEADFCKGLARLRLRMPREESWEAARRAELLYRQLGDADELGFALLVVASIGAAFGRMSEAEQALGEAERLFADATDVRRQAPLAKTRGALHLRRGEPELAIAAFRRQAELWRRAGRPDGESIALGNVGCAQLNAGEVDAAIESLRGSVDRLRASHAPHSEFYVGTLAVALAWRGDDSGTVPLEREAFDFLRVQGATFAPLMAAALQHARRGDAERALLVTGYAYARLPQERTTRPITLPLQQRVRERAAAEHPAATVDSWLRAGEELTEEQAAAIAFDGASLDGFSRDAIAVAPAAESDRRPFAA
jgi:tetratricopeptide (TPR) repeat protein